MKNVLRKVLIVGVAIAALGTTVAASTAPASARGGFGHGGFGHAGFDRDFGRFGHGFGGFGIGLAAGAALAASTYAAYGADCTALQPVYDQYGNYIGSQPVNICN
jgi:hypothetical protein